MSTLLDADLTADQLVLLHLLGAPWAETGEWPRWGYVQHHFDTKRRSDAEAILRSLPRIGSDTPFGAGYGLTTAVTDHRAIGETDTIRLTIAGSIHIASMRQKAGIPFVRVLKHMIQLWDDKPVSPSDPGKAYLRSEGLAQKLRLRQVFVDALPDLLSYEPAITTGNGTTTADGTWEREITRSVLQYRDTKGLEDYIAATERIVATNAAQYISFPATSHLPQPTPDPTPAATDSQPPYLDAELLADLAGVAEDTKWKLGKLLALCHELNNNYAARNPYACAALIRAITDHVPPVFGHADFKQVAAQHTFAMQRTDKAHARALADFKDIAHDALHRPISPNLPMITMHDLPGPTRLRAVLHELVTVLQRQEPS
ncbi:hypothetical protein [Streptomyces sp. NPDC058579]|uniref:hypothetical protein n=1 Tax=Streptomyces sp. NPDC058579 TaxID=3346548 RepID=UPI0036611704